MGSSILPIVGLLLCAICVGSLVIKTSDGEQVKCVNKKQQKAFNHPLLKDHQLQERPSEIPIPIIRKKSKRQAQQAHVDKANCPYGTIPTRPDNQTSSHANRTGPDTDYTPGHEYAIISSDTSSKLYGTKTTINVWDPKIEKGSDEMSISQLWICAGDYETNDLNTIEVGWQVYPRFYMDNKPRLFIYWTSDSYGDGCYNLACPGFIQTDNRIVLGGSISPISTFDNNQSEISFLVWKDRKLGHWWLIVGDNTVIGYWPAEIFTRLRDHASTVQWGGEILNKHTFHHHTSTNMGSGHLPDEKFGKSSYFRNIETIDDNNSLQPLQIFTRHIDHPEFYDLKTSFTDDWGTSFFYGGPGFRDMISSGTVRLGLCSLFFYCCIIILHFII